MESYKNKMIAGFNELKKQQALEIEALEKRFNINKMSSGRPQSSRCDRSVISSVNLLDVEKPREELTTPCTDVDIIE